MFSHFSIFPPQVLFWTLSNQEFVWNKLFIYFRCRNNARTVGTYGRGAICEVAWRLHRGTGRTSFSRLARPRNSPATLRLCNLRISIWKGSVTDFRGERDTFTNISYHRVQVWIIIYNEYTLNIIVHRYNKFVEKNCPRTYILIHIQIGIKTAVSKMLYRSIK